MVVDPIPDTEEQRSRRERILASYVAEGPKLVEEEGLIDFISDESNLDDYSMSGTWGAWDMAYGPYKLREDAIRVYLEKLGSRMGRPIEKLCGAAGAAWPLISASVLGLRRIWIGCALSIGGWYKN